MSFPELLKIASRQYGCFTRDQALGVLTRHQLASLTKREWVVRAWPSVYKIAGYRDTWEQTAKAALLSLPGSALSGTSAAKVWGLTYVDSFQLELTSPIDGPPERTGLVVHRSQQLRAFVRSKNDLALTSPARTIVDLSQHYETHDLGKIFDQACGIKIVTVAEVGHCLDEMVTIGRSKVSNVREVLSQRDPNDEKLESKWEREVLGWIRDAALPEPKKQFRVRANGSRYRLDFAYPELKVNVEADGPHHLIPSVAEYDRHRDTDVSIEGWLVVRVPYTSISRTTVPLIQRALDSRRAAGT